MTNNRSLSFERLQLYTDGDDFDHSIEKGMDSSRKEIDHLYDSVARPMKKSEFDERGSMHTDVRQARLRSKMIQNRGSMSVRSAFSSHRSEFSFHPSINYTNKWKPKYDDHHDHRKMWTRMHNENQKIEAKRRLASAKKQMEELRECTFTPKLVTKKSDAKFQPLNTEQLSSRLYSYAERFKDNKDKLKQVLEKERGENTRFTPHLETSKINKQLEVVKERSSTRDDVYKNLYEDSKRREDAKKRMQSMLTTGAASELSSHDIFLTVSKPSYLKNKHGSVLGSGGKKSRRKRNMRYSNGGERPKTSFSSTIYSAGKS